ncbi:MAG: hypothetical protein IJA67_08585, partial [Oscillospiraceae bacterium]|nr:hypothetical protein [Oscillospiraceae bacterium]
MKQYIRKVTAFLAALSMTAGTLLSFPADTFLIQARASECAAERVIHWTPQEDAIPDADTLFAGYVDSVLYGSTVSAYSVGNRSAGAALTGEEKKVYDVLMPIFAQIAAGERASSSVTIGPAVTGYPVDADVELDIDLDAFDFDIDALMAAIVFDSPYSLYWFDKAYYDPATEVSALSLNIRQFYSGEVHFVFNFVVAECYRADADDLFTADTTLTSAASTTAEKAHEIVERYSGQLDHRKLKGYRDEICALADYNIDVALDTSTPYGDPWQLIWVFDEDPTTKVVCEGYAKAFQYLCDLTDFYGPVSCYSVTGATYTDGDTGAHMWNIVTMEDGKNYMADITNSDTDEDDGFLFLTGASGSPDTYYTFTNADDLSISYFYDTNLPWGDDVLTLADADYEWNTIAGDVVLQENLTVAEGKTLTFLEGATLTMGEGYTLTNEGTLYFEGTGQQFFGIYAGDGAIYQGETLHNHNNDDGIVQQIQGDDENHYEAVGCSDCPIGYTLAGQKVPHSFDDNGFCTGCDAYEPAVLNTEEAYEIGNAGQLFWFAELINEDVLDTNVDAVLTEDIAVNPGTVADNGAYTPAAGEEPRQWTPIGFKGTIYEGHFDGQGHTVSGLYRTDTDSNLGLFGVTSENALIEHLGVVNSFLTGDSYGEELDTDYSYIGGICGFNNGTIRSCFAQGLFSGENYVGGICGYNNGTVSDCFANVNVLAESALGAICGFNQAAVENCYYYEKNALPAGGINSADEEGEAENRSPEQFASGEVTWLLNSGMTDGTQIWYQTIGDDTVPMFEGDTVFCGYTACGDKNPSYSNTELNAERIHTFTADSNGFCTQCDTGYQPAVLNADNVYEIANGGQLYWFMEHANFSDAGADAILTADITVNPGTFDADGDYTPAEEETLRTWTPIGMLLVEDSTDDVISNTYSGKFDGQGHTISGLYLHNGAQSYAALFGDIEDAEIRRVGLTNSSFIGSDFVGGICGYAASSTISYCWNTASAAATEEYGVAGGICGVCDDTTSLISCWNAGSITSYSGVDASDAICPVAMGTVDCCYAIKEPGAEIPEDDPVQYVSRDAFASGEVTYGLNDGVTDGTQIWYQTIGEDPHPVFDGGTVYVGYRECSDEALCYSNDADLLLTERPAHDFDDNGFCTVCDAYEPAVLNEENVYEIGNAGQLYWFAALVNSEANDLVYQEIHAVLTDDIRVNEQVLDENGTLISDTSGLRTWTPIGLTRYGGDDFYNVIYDGIFDGQGHTISGLYHQSTDDYVGLFGQASDQSRIMNLGITDSYFSGNSYATGVCGLSMGQITGCWNTGVVVNQWNETTGYTLANCDAANREHCYWLNMNEIDADGNEVRITEEDFRSGRVTWLLNSGVTDGTQIWYQTIGEDTHPVSDGGTVYKAYAYGCPDAQEAESELYSNTDDDDTYGDAHSFVDGLCEYCGLIRTELALAFDPVLAYTGRPISITQMDFTGIGDPSLIVLEWFDSEGTLLTEPPANAGIYTLRASIPAHTSGDLRYCEDEAEYEFEITKADFPMSVLTVSLLEGNMYDGGVKTLEIGFMESVKGVGEISYEVLDENGDPAVLCDAGRYYLNILVSEGENYHAAELNEDEYICIEIIPAIVSDILDPLAAPIVYGQSLNESVLTDGWFWQDGDVIPDVATAQADFFTAYLPLEGNPNYDYSYVTGYNPELHRVERSVEVIVEKANPVVTPLLIGTTFTEGDPLPEITTSPDDTPGVIEWLVGIFGGLAAGENVIEWYFTPDDRNNYLETQGTVTIYAETTTTEATTTETTTTTTTTTVDTTTTADTTTTSPSETTTADTTTETTTQTTTSEGTTTTTTSYETTTTPASTTSDVTTTTTMVTTETSATTTTASVTTTTSPKTTTTASVTTTTSQKTTTTASVTTTTSPKSTTTTSVTTTTSPKSTTTASVTTTTSPKTTTTASVTTTTSPKTTTT